MFVPPKFYIRIGFFFLLGLIMLPRKTGNNAYARLDCQPLFRGKEPALALFSEGIPELEWAADIEPMLMQNSIYELVPTLTLRFHQFNESHLRKRGR